MAAQDLMTALQLACVNEGWLELWRVWGWNPALGQAKGEVASKYFLKSPQCTFESSPKVVIRY